MSMTTSVQRRGPSVWVPGHFGSLELTDIDFEKIIGSFRTSDPTGAIGPTESAPLSMIHPVDEDLRIQLWEFFVEKLIEQLKVRGELPNDYRGFTVKKDTDWSDDPILVVKLLFESEEEVSESTIHQWNQLAGVIRRHLLRLLNATTPDSSPFRFPFVRVGAAPREEYATSR